jgi:hypothetical protein
MRIQEEFLDRIRYIVYYKAMSELGRQELEARLGSHIDGVRTLHRAVRTAKMSSEYDGWVRDPNLHQAAINRRSLLRRQSGVLILAESISTIGNDAYEYRSTSSRTSRIATGLTTERSRFGLLHEITVGGIALSKLPTTRQRLPDVREVSATVSESTVTTRVQGRIITTQDPEEVKAIQRTLEEMIPDGATDTADPADIFEALQSDPVGFRQEVDSLKANFALVSASL